MADGMVVDVAGPVLTVELDRAPGNLFTGSMCQALAEVLEAPPEGAHVLHLRARGPAFCLGRERTASTAADLPAEVDRLVRLTRALETTALVTVAEVHGDAAGFGVGLAALADVAVAAAPATFRFPEVELDLAPALVLAWLPRVVGRRAAFWLTATGEPVDAAGAAELGLVGEVVAPAELAAVVAGRIAALRRHSPRVHREIRSLLRTVADLGVDQAYAVAADRLVLGSLRRREAAPARVREGTDVRR